MRIIQRGKIPETEVEWETSCRKCGTRFGFFPKEANLIHDFRDGDYYEIPCPVCNAKSQVQK